MVERRPPKWGRVEMDNGDVFEMLDFLLFLLFLPTIYLFGIGVKNEVPPNNLHLRDILYLINIQKLLAFYFCILHQKFECDGFERSGSVSKQRNQLNEFPLLCSFSVSND